ncbi:hypothetical protein CCHR01_19746 [Colletotrichum chrysophilum]|uniref:Uncharacterized protein n=1 Tax=Colletotrichum chrysophilum TaxID=1836956 RepID=A0AAD9A202_9PEZI|nr:hypothetical protein CCHR01_19746 [Colletotrichum chrysophilum]
MTDDDDACAMAESVPACQLPQPDFVIGFSVLVAAQQQQLGISKQALNQDYGSWKPIRSQRLTAAQSNDKGNARARPLGSSCLIAAGAVAAVQVWYAAAVQSSNFRLFGPFPSQRLRGPQALDSSARHG